MGIRRREDGGGGDSEDGELYGVAERDQATVVE
jgi:hypothetical protein